MNNEDVNMQNNDANENKFRKGVYALINELVVMEREILFSSKNFYHMIILNFISFIKN